MLGTATAWATPDLPDPAPPKGQIDPLEWRNLEKGLALGVTHIVHDSAASPRTTLTVLRIAPQNFRFSLHMASETGQALSLAQWGKRNALLGGINASMYREDNMTSTGYMRNAVHTNNPRIGTNLGAFFVAEPKSPDLPQADILEADAPDFEKKLEQYTIVVQNYRFISASGGFLWKKGGPRHSIAVVAKDHSGNILFILCQEPLMAEDFAYFLQQLHLQLSTVMYVEGGAQAGLFFAALQPPAPCPLPAKDAKEAVLNFTPEPDAPHPFCVQKGRQSLLMTKGNAEAPLPNIIGISRR